MKPRRASRGPSAEALIMALPNGRILGEVMPLLQRVGIEPEPAFSDGCRRLSPKRPPTRS